MKVYYIDRVDTNNYLYILKTIDNGISVLRTNGTFVQVQPSRFMKDTDMKRVLRRLYKEDPKND